MIDNIHEACREFDRKKESKRREYESNKSRVRSASGKKRLEELNKYWDYQPGMFDRLR